MEFKIKLLRKKRSYSYNERFLAQNKANLTL